MLDLLGALFLGVSPLLVGFLWLGGVSFSISGALLTLVVLASYVIGAVCLAGDARRRLAASRRS